MTEQASTPTSRLLWPILWLVGFRMWQDGDIAYIKLPRWLPLKQKFADDLAAKIKHDKPTSWPYSWEPFPTDEMTLTLLESVCNINPDTGHTELVRFLDMTSGPIKSVSMNGIEYDSEEAAVADHDYDTPALLEIEVEPGDEPHSQTTVILSLIAEIRRLRGF